MFLFWSGADQLRLIGFQSEQGFSKSRSSKKAHRSQLANSKFTCYADDLEPAAGATFKVVLPEF